MKFIRSKQQRHIIFLLLICFTTSFVYSQSKKEQLEYLNLQLDSIRIKQTKDQLDARSNENVLNEKINQLKTSIESLEFELSEIKIKSVQDSGLISQKNTQIEQLEQRLQLSIDRLRELEKKESIKFLGSMEMNEDIGFYYDKLNVDLNFLRSSEISWFNNVNDLNSISISEQGKQVFQMGAKKYGIIVFEIENPESETYYRSAGTNIIAVYENIKGNWVYIKKFNTFSDPYSFRGQGAELIGFDISGNGKLAILFCGGTMHNGGIIEEKYSIYQFDGQEISKIYSGMKSYNDFADSFTEESDKVDDSFKLYFKATEQEYFDLIETKKSFGKLVSTRILKFNQITKRYE
jgi:hypothetical protein